MTFMAEESAPQTAVPGEDETRVVPDACRTEQAELAWSEAAAAEDLQLPGSWRPVCRNALIVFAACVTVAGVVVAVHQHWHVGQRPEQVLAVVVTTVVPAPVESAAERPSTPDAWSSVPAVDHLVQPPPAPPDYTTSTSEQDSLYFAGLAASGIVVYNRSDAIDTGRYVCQARSQGYTRAAIAVEAISHNPRLSMADGRNFVLAAINAYCPQY